MRHRRRPVTVRRGSSGRRRRRRHWCTVGGCGCGGVQSFSETRRKNLWRLITRYVRVAPVVLFIIIVINFVHEKHKTVFGRRQHARN